MKVIERDAQDNDNTNKVIFNDSYLLVLVVTAETSTTEKFIKSIIKTHQKNDIDAIQEECHL